MKRVLFGSLMMMTVAGACGEEVVVCPKDHHAEGKFCYPDTSPEGGATGQDTATIDAFAPLDSGAAPDTSAADGGPASDTGAAADTALPDASPDASADAAQPIDAGKKNPVGAGCTDDLDCLAGLTCFDWPKGYCTMLSCNSSAGASCPGTSVCWGETKEKHICVGSCDDTADCRHTDGYACKRLTSDFGGVDARLCTPSGKKPAGLTCAGPLDCEGSATCISDMLGGYCARVGCGPNDPCDAGTSCVLRNGKPMCLKNCVADVECAVDPKLARKCVERTDLQKKLVKVCLDSDKAGDIGDPCGADLDCESAKCIIIAKGTCAVGDAACLTDQQCGAAGPCKLDKTKEKGVCGKGCSNQEGCPSGSVCVPGDQFLVGTCQPTCAGPQDVDTCKGVPGMQCVYGQPIAPPFGSAAKTYACAPLAKGHAGSVCTKSDDCASKDCTTNAKGTAGYCTADCGTAQPECPFGTLCVSSGLEQCEKLCAVDYDCPPQMTCQKGAGGKTLCQIP